MKPVKLSVSLLTLLSLSACTTLTSQLPSNDELLQELTGQNGRHCIRSNEINGFGVLDDDIVSVDGRRSQYYLLTTLYRCNSLSFSQRVAFEGNFAQFCGGSSDKINTGEEACPIKSIYQFDSRDDAFAAFDSIKEKREQLRKELDQKSDEKSL